MIVLDASVLIGFLDSNDAHHRAARALLSQAEDADVTVNPVTLAEVLVVPARLGRVDDVLQALAELDVREVAFPVDTAVRLAQLRADTGLRMPDCCVLLSAVAGGAAVASFDDRLRAAARSQGLALFGTG